MSPASSESNAFERAANHFSWSLSDSVLYILLLWSLSSAQSVNLMRFHKMSDTSAPSVAKISTPDAVRTAAPAAITVVKISREATKDAGLVHVGGAMMRF
jgi:hypothetical protein